MSAARPSEQVSTLIETPLTGLPGTTFSAVIVDFPPATSSAPHRHGQAFLYAYVLEGTVASQLEGEPRRVYRQGESWVEAPGVHHVLAENTSRTEPAKLLVTFISHTGDPLVVDDAPAAQS